MDDGNPLTLNGVQEAGGSTLPVSTSKLKKSALPGHA